MREVFSIIIRYELTVIFRSNIRNGTYVALFAVEIVVSFQPSYWLADKRRLAKLNRV